MAKTVSTDKLLSAAKKAAKAEDWVTACACYGDILAKFPKNPRARQGLAAIKPKALPALLKQAQTLQGQSEWADAERHLIAARDVAPDMPEVGLALSACQLELGRVPAAAKSAKRVLRLDPTSVSALNQLGQAQRNMGLSAAARESHLQALALDDSNANTLNNLGILARAMGDKSAAADYYQRALAQDPDNQEMMFNVARTKTFQSGDPDLTRMENAANTRAKKGQDASRLHFALFKAYDEIGEKETAFAHLTKANQQAKAISPYVFQNDATYYALGRAILKEPIAVAPQDPAPFRPVFITGLPRTGTTLVERILSRADGVQAGGELPVVQLAVGRILRTIMGRANKALTADDVQTLRADLLQEFAEYSDGSSVLVDKMPLNFRWIGYICAALPEARIVSLTRDPKAVAWSLYRLSFNGAGNGFIYDFDDIANFMVLHRNVLAHWHSVYPERVFDMTYEDLVRTPEPVTRALAEAAELPWSEAWMSPEKATNQVLTASSDAVRRPMYQDGNTQWTRYESWLKPMLNALDRAELT